MSQSQKTISTTTKMVEVNTETYNKNIKSEIYVDFNTTTDEESRQILELLERSGLGTYYSKKSNSNKTLDMRSIEFYVNGTYENGVFRARVYGEELTVTPAEVARIFDTSSEGVNPLTYKSDDWVESFKMIARN